MILKRIQENLKLQLTEEIQEALYEKLFSVLKYTNALRTNVLKYNNWVKIH